MDGSWDNGGAGAPARSGWPTWAKVLLGCGVAVLLVLGACAGGTAWLVHKAKQDPEGFTKQALAFAINQIRPEWDAFRAAVALLGTDEGCRRLYRENPPLAQAHPTEEAFLAAAQAWRGSLEPLPDLDERLLQEHRVDIQKDFRGRVTVTWRTRGGGRIVAVWDRPARGPGAEQRKLVSLAVH
jgi:hypothetical protein